jgi:hypothetical protein
MIGATMVDQIAGSQVPTLVVRIRLESLQLTVGNHFEVITDDEAALPPAAPRILLGKADVSLITTRGKPVAQEIRQLQQRLWNKSVRARSSAVREPGALPSRHVVRRSVRNAAIRRRGKSDIKSLSG